MIWGEYDAKSAKPAEDGTPPSGFFPGGSSLHSCCTPHGPDAATFEKASEAALEPTKFDKGLAFMFETSHMLRLTDYAQTADHIDADYWKCWQPLRSQFDGEKDK